MKTTTLLFMCTLALLVNAKCSQQNEAAPDPPLKVTLKPGESHQIKANDAIYNITYNTTKVKFSEGVSESNVTHVYMLGDVKLVVNGDSIQVRAEAHYDDKGGRQSSTWTHLKDTQGTADLGSLTIGVANFYPVASGLSVDEGFAIDLLIQRK